MKMRLSRLDLGALVSRAPSNNSTSNLPLISKALRLALFGALGAQSALWACWSEWEYHEDVMSTISVNGCLVDKCESWLERSRELDNGGMEVQDSDKTYFDSAPYSCAPTGGDSGSGGDTGGGSGGGGSTGGCEGANPFRVEDGSVTREIDDLLISGAANGQLVWRRHHNTVPREGAYYFGVGGSWRHSWQYDLVPVAPELPDHPRPGMVLVYPNGAQRVFTQQADGTWAAATRFLEQIISVSDGYEITTPNGAKLHFVENPNVGAPHRYEMQAFTSPYGLVTKLEYGADGWLRRVTEPAGRSLSIDYAAINFKKGVWHEIGRVAQASAQGEWVEFSIPADSAAQARHVRLRGAKDGAPLSVAEVQFLAAGSSSPIAVTASGTGTVPSAATDGDLSTAFTGDRASANVLGFDFHSDQPAATRIRVLAAGGKEQTLVGSVVEWLEVVPSVRMAVSKVTGSDGRSVSYDYSVMIDPVTKHEFATLQTVRYGDGTEAKYAYDWPRANARPLLVSADDPRYSGPAKRIRYSYHDQLGVVHQETNPATGAVYASMELDPNDPQLRIVKYSDMREIRYRIAKDRLAIEERIDSLGRRTSTIYDDAGRVQQVVGPDKKPIEHKYDSRGRLVFKGQGGKAQLTVTRDAEGRVVEMADELGRIAKFERDANGRVTKESHASGITREFTYDEFGRVTRLKDRFGRVHLFSYNEKGQRATWTTPDNATMRFAYDEFGRVASVTDAMNRVSRQEYNERGQITRVVGPDGRTKEISYDAYGRQIRVKGFDGHSMEYAYDELSRVTRRVDTNGNVTTFGYPEFPGGCSSCTLSARPTRIVGPDGVVIELLYDSEGRLIAKTVAVGTPDEATTTYGYDQYNNVTSVTDPMGRVTRYTYDDRHHKLSTVDPLGLVTKQTYDDRGNVTTIIAANGGVTKMEYDSKDRMISRTDALGNATTYEYGDGNLVAAETNSSGERTTYSYDGSRQTGVTYPDGTRQVWEYDAAGRLTKAVSPDGLETTTAYDAGDRVVSVTRKFAIPGTTALSVQTRSFTYDGRGHRIESMDALGRKTQWTYDDRGNVLTVTRPDGLTKSYAYDSHGRQTAVTDESKNVVQYGYGEAGDLTTLTDPKGNVYRFAYDRLHRKTGTIYPDNLAEKWAYDADGELVEYQNRAGQSKTIRYNSGGSEVEELWTPAENASRNDPVLPARVSYSYDPYGRLSAIDNGAIKLSYERDLLGRVLSETVDNGSVETNPQVITRYAYDAAGRRVRLEQPNGVRTIFGYDARGRLITIDDHGLGKGSGQVLARYTYNPQGKIGLVARDNGVETSYAYDPMDNVTDVVSRRGDAVVAASHYRLDELSRRIAQTHEDDVTETYGYDAIGQLVSADHGSGQIEKFSYDASGNRLESVEQNLNGSPLSEAYTVNSLNQYTSIISANAVSRTIVSDKNGNMIDDGQKSCRFDAQNRLVSLENGAGRLEFVYDGKGRCVIRRYLIPKGAGYAVDDDMSVVLGYDLGWNVISSRSFNGKHAESFVHGVRTDELLATYDIANATGRGEYPLHDAVGSVVAVVDDRGQVTSRTRYSAFGRPTTILSGKSSGARTSYLFTGREWLNGFAIADHRYRYYDPATGRWLANDPFAFIDGPNLLAYVRNNPINATDVYGLATGTFSLPNFFSGMLDSVGMTYTQATYSEACENGGIVCHIYREFGQAQTMTEIWSTVSVTIDTGDDGPSPGDWLSAAGGIASVVPGGQTVAAALSSTGAIVTVVDKLVDGDKPLRMTVNYTYSGSSYVKSGDIGNFGHTYETLPGHCVPDILDTGWHLAPSGTVYYPNGE